MIFAGVVNVTAAAVLRASVIGCVSGGISLVENVVIAVYSSLLFDITFACVHPSFVC